MVLFGIKKINGKRPCLHIMDASNDASNLSSRLVKRCKWVSSNVPSSVRGIEFTPNQALIKLRDALDPSKAAMGSNWINFKVNLCTNEEGSPPQTVKRMAQKGDLAKFLCD